MGFVRLCCCLGLGEALLRGLHGAGECVEVAEIAGLLRKLLLVSRDVGDLLVEARQPLAMGADAGLELVALGGQVGELRGQFGEPAFGRCQCCFGLGHALVDARAFFDARLDLFFQLGVFGIEPLQRDVGVRRLLLLAGDVGRELHQAAVELGDTLLGALFLAVEQLAGIGEPLQSGRGAGFRVAQRRQLGGADRLDARGLGLLAGTLRHLANGEVMGMGGIVDVGVGLDPAQVVQRRLGLAHLGGDFAVADRLPRLFLQAVHLSGELADHVLDAEEVGLGSLQPQFRLVAAGVQSGNAGGIFQHAAALLGFRLNDLADLALVDQCR